jgi:hypothetical protein
MHHNGATAPAADSPTVRRSKAGLDFHVSSRGSGITTRFWQRCAILCFLDFPARGQHPRRRKRTQDEFGGMRVGAGVLDPARILPGPPAEGSLSERGSRRDGGACR